MAKVFAVGNRLMMDDKIGIIITENLKDDLNKLGIDVYVCETDMNYALSNICEEDFIFIIDAMKIGIKSGEIRVYPIRNNSVYLSTQHSLSLVSLLSIYYRNFNGYIIGIETENVGYGLGVSKNLSNSINIIEKQVLNIVKTKCNE